MNPIDHVASMPASTAWLFCLSLAVGVVLAWAGFGALYVSWRDYPPRAPWAWRRPDEIAKGRRAWALAAVFATTAVVAFYRAQRLWETDALVPAAGVAIELLRFGAMLLLVRAYREPRRRP